MSHVARRRSPRQFQFPTINRGDGTPRAAKFQGARDLSSIDVIFAPRSRPHSLGPRASTPAAADADSFLDDRTESRCFPPPRLHVSVTIVIEERRVPAVRLAPYNLSRIIDQRRDGAIGIAFRGSARQKGMSESSCVPERARTCVRSHTTPVVRFPPPYPRAAITISVAPDPEAL